MFIEKVVFKNIHKNLQGDYQFSYDFQRFQSFNANRKRKSEFHVVSLVGNYIEKVV